MTSKKDLLNKYKDMYSDHVTKICNLHNANLAYLKYPNRTTTKKLKFAINDLKSLAIPTRRVLDEIQTILIQEKIDQVATNKRIRAETTARRIAREQARKKRKNDNR
jgi:translation elongation factor EF-Tu-like GTPase